MRSWIRRVVHWHGWRFWQYATGALCLLAVMLGGASWYLTAPLEKPGSGATARLASTATSAPKLSPGDQGGTPDPHELPAQPAHTGQADWPDLRLEGQPAKELLFKMMQEVDRSFRHVSAYTLTFRKQERIGGKLLPEQTYFLKVRQQPFAIYMRCLHPVAGRELIYAEGHYDNDVVAHPVGMARYLVPRLKVPPDHPMILAESRHPMNQAGLGNLIHKLLGFRQMDLDEPEEITVLDRTTVDGKPWLRSIHIHPEHRPGRPFVRAEILYDPESRLPLRFTGYDWPADGKTDPPLGERYCYDDLDLTVILTAKDFDPANPDYEFHRF